MVLNAAVQMLREADELKQKILKFKSGTSMLQERSLWVLQQQLQKVYQKVLVLDLDYALDKKVEQDLWNVGFKQQIEALQAISKDRKNPLRSEGQAMLSWVLQAAAGFYLCLLHQICTTFKLDLPFRRRASMLGLVEEWGAGCVPGAPGVVGPGSVPPASARYICQHCLVHLGDLARYRQQLRVAHTFYRHALAVSAHSGQPYNQLALVAWRRARRLGALYWHVRSLLVRAPFPPAPANLARTLRAAANPNTNETKDLPVIPGLTSNSEPTPASKPGRLDAHSYVTELIKAIHYIHTVEELDKAAASVNLLNSSLTALIATDSFESMTLIKMACVLIWLVHSSTEELSIDSTALSEGEVVAAKLSCSLAGGALLALLLPHYTANEPLPRAMPALKVWLSWVAWHERVTREAGWSAHVALWPALAHLLNMVAPSAAGFSHAYDSVPLPEDEELTGFLPLEPALKGLKFPNHAAWDTYGGRIPDIDENEEDDDADSPPEPPPCLSSSPELEHRVRAYRLVQLGKRLADIRPDHLTYIKEDGVLKFTASSLGGEQLSRALEELSVAAGEGGPGVNDPPEPEDESDEEPSPPPPVVISEADFREKVREIRVGILKPQGSLERAREERALATQDDQEGEASDEGKSEERKETRKSRVNIAMAAIMRKQEETSKQVKFVTPPPTPDSTTDSTEAKEDKPKTIQPKAIKSLANLPIGRKTGGILSLKDKSAGYPHLVNTEEKKPEKEDAIKKETKPSQGSSQNSQNYQLKRQENVTSPSWPQTYPEGQRINFQKNYGIQNTGLSYNPNYPAVNNQGIKLPVVNPKEIDVRTAALQKQNSRQEMFQDGPKFNPGYQMSGDKKNFLNDLPPRFANQYRYWQTAQDNQFENKFRDDNFKPNTLFNNQRTWSTGQPQPNLQNPTENFQQMWWKPEQNFNQTFPPPPVQGNFYSPNANLPNPYQNVPSYNVQNMPNKQENYTPNYLQSAIGQPQLQTLQNLVASPNFNSSLNSFNSYAAPVSYDSAMYPQFSNKLGYQPLQMKMMDKNQLNFQGNKDLMEMGTLGFGSNAMDMQQRGLNFNEPLGDGSKSLDQIGSGPGPALNPDAGNTYSLFSGADASAWHAGHAHNPPVAQSLWSGPGPSPLERLLDQQKQMKPPQ